MALEFKKELAGVEDFLFGFGTVEQGRGIITRFNAGHVPFSDTQTTIEAIEDRLTELESDNKYARKLGNENNLFEVATASGGSQAPRMEQVQTMTNARAPKTDVILKGDSSAYIPLYDNDPTNKGFVDTAITTLRDSTLLKDNTAVYDPIGDYNPATKKYADEHLIALLDLLVNKGVIAQIEMNQIKTDRGIV